MLHVHRRRRVAQCTNRERSFTPHAARSRLVGESSEVALHGSAAGVAGRSVGEVCGRQVKHGRGASRGRGRAYWTTVYGHRVVPY
eukprot:scaffold42898_cov62-Phaeocystis_antarctica.AAC.3